MLKSNEIVMDYIYEHIFVPVTSNIYLITEWENSTMVNQWNIEVQDKNDEKTMYSHNFEWWGEVKNHIA
jgi:hypothetical protein